MPATLIVFAGPPCAGKSTIAAEISARRNLPHLQMDTTRQRIMPDSPHTREDRRVAYRAMHFAAELLLSYGIGVILDAPYGHLEDRAEVARAAAASGAVALLVECTVPPETALERLQQRGPDPVRIDLTPARVERMVRAYRYSRLGLLLDTATLNPQACADQVEAALDAGMGVDLGRWVGLQSQGDEST